MREQQARFEGARVELAPEAFVSSDIADRRIVIAYGVWRG